MEPLAKVLSHIREAQAKRSTTPSQTPMESSDSDTEPGCHTCGDRGFVRFVVGVEDPRFGQVSPCPVCVLKERENVDWFAELSVTKDNAHAI